MSWSRTSTNLALRKRGCSQANRVALTNCCRGDNSFGDDFAHHFRLASVLKHFAGSFERFADRRSCLRVERTRWHKRMS